MEFLAEDEVVEIVPNIRMESLNMICVITTLLTPFCFILFCEFCNGIRGELIISLGFYNRLYLICEALVAC